MGRGMHAEAASDPSRKRRSSSEGPFPVRVRLLGGYREEGQDHGQARFTIPTNYPFGGCAKRYTLLSCTDWSFCEPEVFGTRVGLTPRDDTMGEGFFRCWWRWTHE